MLRLLDAALARGTHVLYEHVTLTASDGERVALIGENGCSRFRRAFARNRGN